MKSIIQYILCISLLSIVTLKSEAQVKQDSTTHFTVHGECEQCKERIEAAVKGRGVSQANWDESSQQLTVTYNPSKIKLRQLHKRIAAVGTIPISKRQKMQSTRLCLNAAITARGKPTMMMKMKINGNLSIGRQQYLL